jgi:hypothetical protein
MHIRRTANGGYIARHDLRDKEGNPPNDGQRPDAEYGLSNPEELAAHVAEHMGAPSAGAGDEEEQMEQE